MKNKTTWLGIVPYTIFGLSFLFTKVIVNDIDNIFQVIGLRLLIAAITLIALKTLGLITVDLKGKSLKPLMTIAILQPILYFTLETYGVKYSTTSQVGIMISFIPIVVTLLAVVVLREKTSLVQMMMITISIVGIIVINSDLQFSKESLLGFIFLTGAVLTAAVYQILSRKASKTYTSTEITYVMMIVGAIFFNVVGLVMKPSMDYFAPLFDLNTLLPLLYLGVLSSVVAFFLINYVLSRLPASKASILGNLTTLIAIIAGVVVLKEPFSIYKIIGSSLILIGVYGTTRSN